LVASPLVGVPRGKAALPANRVFRMTVAGAVFMLVVVPFALAFASGGWERHAPLPVPRTEVASTAFGREIAVVGGFLADGGSSRKVDLYSPASDAWRSAPDLPAGVNHASTVVARGRLYVLGGYGAERSAFVLTGDGWRTLAMPAPRAAAGAAVLRGTIYVVGGVGGNGLARSMPAYDTRTGRWRMLPGPKPRQHLAVAATRGRIYAVAGRISGLATNMTLVESWAPGEKRWRREAPSGTLRAVYAYDVPGRRWRRLPDLPTPRHGLGVAALGGVVYVIGGGPQPGLHVSDANESLRVR